MITVPAGRPLEAPRHPVGRRTFTVTDHERRGRRLGVEVWYPAVDGGEPATTYELFPGVSFASPVARHGAQPSAGRWPLVLMSHGRTGMRISYSTVCEALAARGAVVVAADHPGDQLADWLSGNQADDRTNEVDRVADAHLVLRALLHGHDELPVGLLNAIDHERVVLAGHSYGAYTAFATVAGARGTAAHPAVRAVIGFQPYTRTMSDGLLGRVTVPALMVVSLADQVTPPTTDAERPWALLRSRPLWRLDLDGAGHQAVSDVALYAELADHVPFLPEPVRQYLAAAADGRPWRDLMRTQLDVAWAFLLEALEIDATAAADTVRRLDTMPGVTLRRR